MRRAVLLSLLFALALYSGCKKTPTEPLPVDPGGTTAGTYYGIGRFSGNDANVALAINALDTLGRYSGSIQYSGASSSLAQIRTTTAQDTVWFSYSRNSTEHAVWATVRSSGLTIHFSTPEGIPAFQLSRTSQGRNMSGMWHGSARSDATGSQGAASMTMDETGSLFFGHMVLSLFQTYDFTLNSGVSSEGAFQLNGRMTIFGTDYDIQVFGQYITADAIEGSWHVGPSGTSDHGVYLLERRFE